MTHFDKLNSNKHNILSCSQFYLMTSTVLYLNTSLTQPPGIETMPLYSEWPQFYPLHKMRVPCIYLQYQHVSTVVPFLCCLSPLKHAGALVGDVGSAARCASTANTPI